jgi:hypothetical protein
MPTNRRKRLAPRQKLIDSLDEDQIRDLLYGEGWFEGFTDATAMKRAWELHREVLREAWSKDNPPGTRCFAEWCFEIVPKHGERRTTEHFPEHLRGKLLRHGILHTRTWPAFQENEGEYLQRHNLLTQQEKRKLGTK